MKEYRDFYFRKAKAENYPARSVYKLKEIDAKFHILRKGMHILDLGAAPGSWTLYCAERAGVQGVTLGCDIQPLATIFPPQARFIQSDIFNPSPEFAQALKENAPFHAILSDMAPATTGVKITDQARSHELASAAFELACKQLATGGNFVVKIFMGPDAQNLGAKMRKVFGQVKNFKPKSSRSESKETYFIGTNYLEKSNE